MQDFEQIEKDKDKREAEQAKDSSYAKARAYADYHQDVIDNRYETELVSDTEGFERVCKDVM